jgi:hypothetical protein
MGDIAIENKNESSAARVDLAASYARRSQGLELATGVYPQTEVDLDRKAHPLPVLVGGASARHLPTAGVGTRQCVVD